MRANTLKLVVVSHPCIVPENQLLFQRIQEHSGWDISIIIPADWRTDFHDSYPVRKLTGFQGKIIPVPVFPKGNITFHVYHWRLLQILQAERPDVIYVHNESHALSTFQAIFFNRYFLNAAIGFYAAQNIRRSYPWPLRAIEKFNLESADFCFPVSESARATILEKKFTGRVAVLPLGVDDGNFPTREAKMSGPAVVGYAGRLVAQKGVDVLLRALARVAGPEWRCDIIGDGPMKDSLLDLAAELGIAKKVRFLGYVDHGEIARYLQTFSMLVLPSLTAANWKEQFGRVIIEALAAGVPVIGSDSGEIPFLIRKLEGGLVVRENDVDDLAGAIDRLLADPGLRDRLAENGMTNVRKHFLMRRIAADFVDLLADILREHQ
jgi:glycosyltransferase involved in cell wall biosynthesis